MFHTSSMTFPLQQGAMEYNHTGMGTIVQTTWWVQCTHVHIHVVHGHQHDFFKLQATSIHMMLKTHVYACVM